MLISYQHKRFFLIIFLWVTSLGSLYAQEDEVCRKLFENYDTKIESFIQQAYGVPEATTYIQAAHTLRFFIQIHESYASYIKTCSPDDQKKFYQFEGYLITSYRLLDDALFMVQYDKEGSDGFMYSVDRIQNFFNSDLLFLHTLGRGNTGRMIIPLPISSSSQSSISASITSLMVVVVGTIASFVAYFALKDFFTTEYKMKLGDMKNKSTILKKQIKGLKENVKPQSFISFILMRKGINSDLTKMLTKLNNLEGEINTVSSSLHQLQEVYEQEIMSKNLKFGPKPSYKGEIEVFKDDLIKKLEEKISNLEAHESSVQAVLNAQSKYSTEQCEIYKSLGALKKCIDVRRKMFEAGSATPPVSPKVLKKFKDWSSLSAWGEAEKAFPQDVAG